MVAQYTVVKGMSQTTIWKLTISIDHGAFVSSREIRGVRSGKIVKIDAFLHRHLYLSYSRHRSTLRHKQKNDKEF